jgi:TonB family protein
MKVIMKNIPRIRYAYDKELKRNPKLEGRVDFRFYIDGYGNVIKNSIINTSTQDTVLDNKIMTIINKFNFGKIYPADDTTTVVYPFVFQPK